MKTEIRVLEVFREDGSKLWLYRRAGFVGTLSPDALGMLPCLVHVVDVAYNFTGLTPAIRARIPNNRPKPLHPRRRGVVRNRAGNSDFFNRAGNSDFFHQTPTRTPVSEPVFGGGSNEKEDSRA